MESMTRALSRVTERVGVSGSAIVLGGSLFAIVVLIAMASQGPSLGAVLSALALSLIAPWTLLVDALRNWVTPLAVRAVFTTHDHTALLVTVMALAAAITAAVFANQTTAALVGPILCVAIAVPVLYLTASLIGRSTN